MAAEWLVRGVLPARGVGFLVGAPGTGKSTVAIALAGAIAEGGTLHEWPVEKAGGVVYAAAEGESGLDRRFVAAVGEGRGARIRLLLGLPPLSERDGTDAFKAQVGAAAKEFADEGSELRLVVLDTVAASRAFTDDDENRQGPWTQLFGWLRDLADEHRCAVLLLHHPKHDQGGNGRSRSSLVPRGSSAAEGAADFRLTLRKHGGDQVLAVGKMREDLEGDLASVRLEGASLEVGSAVRATFGSVGKPDERGPGERKPPAYLVAGEDACREAKSQAFDTVTDEGKPIRALTTTVFQAAFDEAYPNVIGKTVSADTLRKQRAKAQYHMTVRTPEGEHVVRMPDGME